MDKGHLHRVHWGVYAVGHPGTTLEALFMAAILAGGDGAFLSHWAAAALRRLVRWDSRRVDVTVPGTSGRERKGIRFHHSRSVAECDITRHHGIPISTPARILLEIAPQLGDQRLKRVVRQAQAERLANVGEIADVVRRANGHRGAKRLAAVIASGAAPTRSGHQAALEAAGERVLRTTLNDALANPSQLVRRLAAAGAPYTDAQS